MLCLDILLIGIDGLEQRRKDGIFDIPLVRFEKPGSEISR
jgi:hypothetical protein